MKNCVSCGHEIKADAKFCPFCGAEQPSVASAETNASPEVEASTQETIRVEETPKAAPQATTPQAKPTSPQMEALASSGRNYFQFLNKNTLKPELNSQEVDFNGLISFVLIALFTSLGLTHMFQEILNGMTGGNSPFPIFIEVFLWTLCAFFVNVVALYLVSSQIFHKGTSFLGAFNQIFAPVSVGVYISAVAFLASFLFSAPSFIYFVLILLPFALVNLSFAASMWDSSAKPFKAERFYIVFAAYACVSIADYIVARIFLSLLASKFDPTYFIQYFMNSNY